MIVREMNRGEVGEVQEWVGVGQSCTELIPCPCLCHFIYHFCTCLFFYHLCIWHTVSVSPYMQSS
jgi:hypothetical protein